MHVLRSDQLSSSGIEVTWTDNANDELGFKVERSEDGGSTWSLAASLPADTSSDVDTGLAAGTDYLYRIAAFNGSGQSRYSAVAAATTDPGSPIDLSATATKARALVTVDLTWSGASTAVDIYRDGGLIAAAETNDGSYSDPLGKVRDSFEYQVCETGSAVCSDPVTVTP